MSHDRKLDPRFARTMFVVEASSYERLCLWKEVADEAAAFRPVEPRMRSRNWIQERTGIMVTVGEFHGLPVNILCSWAYIDGQLVLFHEAISLVTHIDMIDEWLADHCNPRWDGGSRRATCDAMNFSHCLDAIDEANAGRFVGDPAMELCRD